jgi:hypothetical protein
MARTAKNYELVIAALGGALAMVTLLLLWERSSIEAAAKAVDTSRVHRSRGAKMFDPLWPYQPALGLLPPDQQGEDGQVGPSESDSPYDVFSPYLHAVPTSRPAAVSTAPHPAQTAALRAHPPKSAKPSDAAMSSDYWVPDVSGLLVPAAALAMLTIPLAELGSGKNRDGVMIWSPTPSPEPPELSGPFHLFFTTESPTGVAPVAESAGGGVLSSSTLSTVASAVSTTTSSVTGLASSTTSEATSVISSATSTATGLVSSVLRRH